VLDMFVSTERVAARVRWRIPSFSWRVCTGRISGIHRPLRLHPLAHGQGAEISRTVCCNVPGIVQYGITLAAFSSGWSSGHCVVDMVVHTAIFLNGQAQPAMSHAVVSMRTFKANASRV